MKTLEELIALTAAKFEGVTDKAGAPYIEHCKIVMANAARVAKELGLSDKEISVAARAGLLHDLIEDTDVTLADIIEWAGDDVALAVLAVTKEPDLSKEDYLHAIKMNKIALIVKIVDATHNSDYSRYEAPTAEVIEKCRVYASLADELMKHYAYNYA